MARVRVYKKDIASLQEAFDTLEDHADEIRDQIRKAKDEQHTTGEHAEWYRLARLALKIKRKKQEKVGRLLAKLKREERQRKGLNVARCFVDEARRVLPEDTFDGIMDVAKDEMAIAAVLDSSA